MAQPATDQPTARSIAAGACPACGSRRTRVICTTPTDDGTATVRRRCCDACSRRWYSLQAPEQPLEPWQVQWVASTPNATRSDRVRVHLHMVAA